MTSMRLGSSSARDAAALRRVSSRSRCAISRRLRLHQAPPPRDIASDGQCTATAAVLSWHRRRRAPFAGAQDCQLTSGCIPLPRLRCPLRPPPPRAACPRSARRSARASHPFAPRSPPATTCLATRGPRLSRRTTPPRKPPPRPRRPRPRSARPPCRCVWRHLRAAAPQIRLALASWLFCQRRLTRFRAPPGAQASTVAGETVTGAAGEHGKTLYEKARPSQPNPRGPRSRRRASWRNAAAARSCAAQPASRAPHRHRAAPRAAIARHQAAAPPAKALLRCRERIARCPC